MKKVISLALVMVMLLCSMYTGVVFADGDTVNIATMEDLISAASAINSDANGGEGKTYNLTANIDLGGRVWANPMGTIEKPFKGTFNGNGNVIMNYKLTCSEAAAYGLFGAVGGNGSVTGLGVERVAAAIPSEFVYVTAAGAIAGMLLDNASVTNCYAKKVSMDLSYGGNGSTGNFVAGGALVGVARGTGVVVENCYSLNSFLDEAKVNCDAGIVGALQVWNRVANCYSDNTIARKDVDYAEYTEGAVSNCFYATNAPWPAENYAGEKVEASALAGKAAILGGAFLSVGGAVPILTWEEGKALLPGEGTESKPYLISTVADLENVSSNVLGTAEGLFFRLENDLDLGGAVWTSYIGTEASPFQGEFLGNEHVIRNFKINPRGNRVSGLFGFVGGFGAISKLGIENVTVEQVVDEWEAVGGGMIGKLTDAAVVYECFAKNVSLVGNFTEGGERFKTGGGLIAWVDGNGVEVYDCYAINCASNGAVNNDAGLIGYLSNAAKVQNCYTDTLLTLCDNKTKADSMLRNAYYGFAGTLPWPGVIGDGFGYAGEYKSLAELKDMAVTLGSSFAEDSGYKNGGYPILAWEPHEMVADMAGTGTQLDPYQISAVKHLAEVAAMTETEGKYFKLMNDIDMGQLDWDTPIGTTEAPFKGTFNGNEFVIKNYKVSVKPASFQGLFGVVGGNAVIEKLGVMNTVGASYQGMTENDWNMCYGALAGKLMDNAKVNQCFSRKATISTAHNDGQFQFGGGLIGTITSDAVTVSNSYCVGMTFQGVIDYDSGLIGGITANNPTIENCYADTTLVRFNKGYGTNMSNSYYVGTAPWPGASSEDAHGWYAGKKLTVAEMRAKAEDLGSVFTADIAMQNSGYPVFTWQKLEATLGGEGTYDNPYLIRSKTDLGMAAMHTETEGKYYKLENDIDLEDDDWVTYFGADQTVAFQGDFNGNGHVIKNYTLKNTGSDTTGIFAYTGGNAYIHDLGVENVTVILTEIFGWDAVAGGLIGIMNGNSTVERCYVKNIDFSATFTRSKATEHAEFESGGGLVGKTDGEGVEIRNCYSMGYTETYPEGSLPINNNDGGLLGHGLLMGEMENCFSDTTVGRTKSWLTVDNCYQNQNGGEWPSGYTWGATVNPITELGDGWSSDFVTSFGEAPVLKWEKVPGYYNNMVPSGAMNLSNAMANTLYGITGGTIVKTDRDHRITNALKLPVGQTMTMPLTLTAGTYYRVTLNAMATGSDVTLAASLGTRNLAAELRDTVVGKEWETKALYVKATETDVNLTISGSGEILIDDVEVIPVDDAVEYTCLSNSINLDYQKLSLIDCDIKIDQTICDGIEVLYTSSNINEYGKLTEERPLGFGAVEEKFTGYAKVDDQQVEVSMEVAIAEREPYDILNLGLVNAEGKPVFGLNKAVKLGTVDIDVNQTGKNATLYAAMYQNGVLVSMKSVPITSDQVALNMDIADADKLKLYVLEDGKMTPLSLPEATGDILADDAQVTIRTIGDSICQTYDDNTLLKGWGQKIGAEFTSNVTVDNSLARSGMSAHEFLMSHENRFGKLMDRLEAGNYVLIQLSHNDHWRYSADDFRNYLNQFISGARQKGAIPVLITPPDQYDAVTNEKADDGVHYKVTSMLSGFPDVMRALAQERNVPLIDFNQYTLDWMADVGLEGVAASGYYIGTVEDPLHFTSAGAEWIADFVARGLVELGLPIGKFAIESERVALLSDSNGSFTIASSAGVVDAKASIDGDIVTASTVGDYDGQPIYDVNGETGDDYVMLMTAEVQSRVPWSVSN